MLNLLSKVEGEEEKGVNNLFTPLKLNIWKDMITILICFLSRTTSLGRGPELMDASWLCKQAQDVRDFSNPKCKRALPLAAGLC